MATKPVLRFGDESTKNPVTKSVENPAVKSVNKPYSEEQHWGNPSIDNRQTMSQVEDKANKGVKEIDSATDKTQARMYSKANEQYNKKKSDLDVNAGKNIAKTGGQYGSLNGKTFSHTLNLMRQADAYNNKPTENIHRIGLHGVQDLGPAYNRPQIETEEMREMQRNRQLDLTQKTLAVQLQDAVNHKDLNAFIQLYQQLYNTEITRNQAEILMHQWTRQQEMSNILMKDITTFNAYFRHYFSEETCRYIYDLAIKRPTMARMLTQAVFDGFMPPDIQDYLLEQVTIAKTNEYKYKGLSDYDAYRRAEQDIERNERMRANVDAAAITQDQSIKNRWNARKQAKEIGK